MNNRIAPRKIFRAQVVFQDEFGGDFIYFISTNISTSGIFIESKLPFKSGLKVLLKFSLYENDAPITVAAEVMRQSTKVRGPGRRKPVVPGVGLKFLGLSQEDYLRIERFVEGG